MPMAAQTGRITYSSHTCGSTAQASGISPYSTIRARSQPSISRHRSSRSARLPAKIPATIAAAPATPVSRPI